MAWIFWVADGQDTSENSLATSRATRIIDFATQRLCVFSRTGHIFLTCKLESMREKRTYVREWEHCQTPTGNIDLARVN